MGRSRLSGFFLLVVLVTTFVPLWGQEKKIPLLVRLSDVPIAQCYGFTDREVQQVIYNGAKEMPQNPYPSVAGIKRVMQLYDSNAMRRYKPEDFYDDSFLKELDASGFIDNLYKK